jgi:putative flippase GtrA
MKTYIYQYIDFIKYIFFGGFGVLSDLILYSFLIMQSINYQEANAWGYFLGTMISFILNRKYTFKIKDKVMRRFIKFWLVAMTGYLTSVLLLFLLVPMFDSIISKLVTLTAVVFIQFTLNKKFTFKKEY